MLRFLLALSLFTSLNASWHMFSDGRDTYLYDDITGNVYIKHRKGSKGNEDYFVKMSNGSSAPKNSNKPDSKELEMANTNRYKDSEEKKKLMEKARELKSKMLDATIQ